MKFKNIEDCTCEDIEHELKRLRKLKDLLMREVRTLDTKIIPLREELYARLRLIEKESLENQ